MPNKQLWINLKNKLKLVFNKIKHFFNMLIKNNPITKERLKALGSYLRRSWKSIAVILPTFIVLYYVLGGYVTNKIDKTTTFEINANENELHIINAGTHLIKREVDDHMWTPNLPFIFPGYALDNMPSFQTGIIQSVRVSIKSLANIFDDKNLKEASTLLKYPPNIWILSKTENLSLAPSSGAQYRKAKKELLKFNKEFVIAEENKKEVLYKVLTAIEKNLNKISANLDNQVREVSSNWFDNNADNVFYLNQGRLYGHYIMLKALSQDFKKEIVELKQYENLTTLFKALEDGFLLNPLIVRNGTPQSVMAPNHLLTLNFYVAKSCYHINKIKENVL